MATQCAGHACGNKLFRNDEGHFTDVSESAGIYGSKIGFGLGVSAGDVNRDGWLDIYISNDFFERDYLYINNKNGTFTESLEDQINETSLGAMGADMADINNDAFPDIFVTEMTPEGNSRQKTKALFESWDRYQMKLKNGYYHQFARNVLQLNNKNGSFSEIGRLSGVSTTDWSWGALIMDIDNDGWKDIFVANGIYKDLLDRDYLDIYSNPSMMRSIINTQEQAILKIIDMIPSVKIPNYAFHNNGDLTFSGFSVQWGLADPSHSNGAVYGDLDNDGDLDIVVNNVNMPPFIYRNDSRINSETNFLVLELTGSGKNSRAIGASVTLYYKDKTWYQELVPARGFMSSVDYRLHFGLGSTTIIDSLIVKWPDGNCSKLNNTQVNQFIKLEQDDSEYVCPELQKQQQPTIFQQLNQINGLNFIHKENDFSDFDRDQLLFQMLSNEGPHMAVGDLNGDNLDDIFICGAKDSPGELYLQEKQGNFRKSDETVFETDKISEDTDCAIFDADGDGDQDLYVASGGNEFPSSSSALNDRLYINDGKGHFVKSDQTLPAGKYESTSCVQPADFDRDGDIDLFVGIRLLPFSYGIPVDGYLLENNGHGYFTDITEKAAPSLTKTGMITDMVWADIDNDTDLDIVIAGDWMPVKILINNGNLFTDESERFNLSNTEGWWHTIIAKDVNNDGRIDFILGNHGLNSMFKASVEKPVTMYVNDFDLNGSIEQIICSYNGDKSYPVVKKDDLVKQIPSLETKYKKFDDYKDQTLKDIFPSAVLERSVVLFTREMESSIMLNSNGESFNLTPLPADAQFTPVYAIAADDFDNDGITDLVIGGNQYRAKPETGIYDAGYGLFLKGTANGKFNPVSPDVSGFYTKGEIRDIKNISINGNRVIAVARNNDKLRFFKY